jgi:hypothetical protein
MRTTLVGDICDDDKFAAPALLEAEKQSTLTLLLCAGEKRDVKKGKAEE